MKLKQTIIALDQVLNTIAGGWADETMSARGWRNAAQGSGRWSLFVKVVNKAFFWQKNHCREAYEREVARSHMPAAYRPAPDAQVSE